MLIFYLNACQNEKKRLRTTWRIRTEGKRALHASVTGARKARMARSEFLDFHVLEPHLVAVILKQDTAIAVAEVGPVLVLAIGHQGIPLLRATLILEQFHAIEPVLHVTVLDDDGGCVPRCDVKRLVVGDGDEVVERPQLAVSLHAQLGIGMTQVVQYLELATYCTALATVHVGINKVLDAAVGTLCDLEINLENEVVVGLLGHDVTAVAALGTRGGLHLEDAILYTPTLLGKGGELGSAPPLGGLAVPQKLPALALLLLGEHIVGHWLCLGHWGGQLLLGRSGHHRKQHHEKNNLFHQDNIIRLVEFVIVLPTTARRHASEHRIGKLIVGKALGARIEEELCVETLRYHTQAEHLAEHSRYLEGRTGSQLAYQGAVIQMIAHGLSAAGLFILCGQLYERIHTRDMRMMGGLWSKMKWLPALSLFFAVATLGMPGTGNFVGEFMILFGSFQVVPVITVISTFGLVFASVYSLAMLHRAYFGKAKSQIASQELPGMSLRELFMILLLVLLLVLLGFYPQPILDTSHSAIGNIQQWFVNSVTTTRP